MLRGKDRTLDGHAGSAALPALPVLPGERVTLGDSITSGADDRLRHPIDPADEVGRALMTEAVRRFVSGPDVVQLVTFGAGHHPRAPLRAGRGPL
jgi:hypothetical protein